MVIILANYDGLESLMLHTKFHGNRPTDSGEEDFCRVFTIYGDHMTKISRIKFQRHYPSRLQIKFQLDRPSSFREDL